jgi:carbonic anhydrase
VVAAEAELEILIQMNPRLIIQKIRDRRVVLREIIDKGEIGLVGAMYDVSTGKVLFYE